MEAFIASLQHNTELCAPTPPMCRRRAKKTSVSYDLTCVSVCMLHYIRSKSIILGRADEIKNPF